MSRKRGPEIDLAAFDAALGAVVASGWKDGPGLDAGSAPMKPPADQVAEARQTLALEAGLQYPPIPIDHDSAPEPSERSAEDLPAGKALLNIGVLADLVSGQKTPEQAAGAAGVTVSELHSALATTLAQVDPKELARAMGIQVAASQLKATAVWNALLADLLEDIRLGRAKADVKLELLKVLGKIGRLEPKEDKGVGAGGGFQLQINIGDGAKPVVIDATK